MAKRFYITTPIYYVNSVPHVGHALTMLVCDVEARFHRLMGEEAVFLTGTDENGLKVMEAAEAAGETPQQFVDRISQTFAVCAENLNMSNDIFMRTTSEQHKVAAQKLFEILRDKGFVYLDKYEGWYDVSAETFVREADLVDGKSPDGNEVRWVEEANWFFKLSAFGDRLLKQIEENPGWLLPESRKNEVVSFINQGLRDICITRANPGWGIPVPGDESKVIYVWFDALINYLAATNWPNPGWEELWPADVHWMAKEIFTRFHATLWPAMLMAAELPLPKAVIAHGWFVFGDSKMSKSKGNVILPDDLKNYFVTEAGCSPELSVDAVRFVLARSLPFEGDSQFNYDEINKHYNSDLANDLGNALNRSITMAHKFCGGIVPDCASEADALDACRDAKAKFASAMESHRVDLAVEHAIDLIRFLNKYIDTRAPWALAKNADPALNGVVRSMLLCLRTAEALFASLLPTTAQNMAAQLGLSPLVDWNLVAEEGSLPGGTQLNQPQPMFPRIDLKAQAAKQQPAEPAPAKKEKPVKEKPKFEPPAEIEFADFMKVNLRVARIIEAEPLEGSEKLMKLKVKIGDETRQILAGIKKKYGSADLIGRQIIVVANLKPAKLMGHESQGMLLAADDVDGSPILLQPDSEAPEGTSVH